MHITSGNYHVWVSESEFQVHIIQGKKNNYAFRLSPLSELPFFGSFFDTYTHRFEFYFDKMAKLSWVQHLEQQRPIRLDYQSRRSSRYEILHRHGVYHIPSIFQTTTKTTLRDGHNDSLRKLLSSMLHSPYRSSWMWVTGSSSTNSGCLPVAPSEYSIQPGRTVAPI